MIAFKKLILKNFLSIGASPLEIDFDSVQNTIIFGDSGSGKSAIIDGLSYGLFGRTYRDINKAQIVNSINKKKLYCEVHFNDYKVIRQTNPNKFEIYKNQDLIEQTDVKSYQSHLEEILGFNFKTFSQIVILGSAAFTPFMKLSTPQRREVIEHLLDLSVFSKITEDFKKSLSNVKSDIQTLTVKLDSKKDMIDYLNSQNTSSSEKNDYSEKIDDLNQQIKECEETFKLNNEKLLSKKEKIDGFDIKKFKVEKEDYKTKYLDAFSKVKYYSKQKETIDEGKCEKCHQDISDDYREKFYKANDDLEKVWREKSDEFKSKIEENERVIEKYENFLQKIHSLESNQKFLNEKINDLKDKVDSYQELQEKEEQKDEGIDKKLKEVNKEIKELNLSLSENRKERDNLNVAITMMKDDGIKSVLIDNYIPIFNNIINSYLEKFNLFISFELDSQFNETIKSRYRDKFSYNSFSEGEKSRINLAILLAFRHITQMNNNINCDLLIIDELVDNIDSDNVNSVLDCIGSVEGINNIFISHNPDIKSHTIFDRTIKVEKIKGFSEYEVQ